MKACVECLLETGVGIEETNRTHGIYTQCHELIADGWDEPDIIEEVYARLTRTERDELAYAKLRTYAYQARRAWNRRPEVTREMRSEKMKALWRASKSVKPHGRMIFGAGHYLKQQTMEQQIAMGRGVRIARGDMTVAHCEYKVEQLKKFRDGLNEAIRDFEGQAAYLQEIGYETLFDAAAAGLSAESA